MTDKTVLAELAQFTGSWFRHTLNRKVLYTEGVRYVAEQAGAYWLVDEIALAQVDDPAVKDTPFQVWNLFVKDNAAATLECSDGAGNAVYVRDIAATGFPAPGVRFFFEGGVLMLPPEYRY